MSLQAARKRLIVRFGQTVVLTRGDVVAMGKGVLTRYQPDQIVGTLRQGDARVEVLAADFAAIAGGPRNPDELAADGVSYTVLYANPVREGETVIGWSLVVRGG